MVFEGGVGGTIPPSIICVSVGFSTAGATSFFTVKSALSPALNIVKGSGYDKYDEEKKLVNEARKRLGDNIDIKFNYVENLQRSKTGKLRFVISNLKEANLGIVKK